LRSGHILQADTAQGLSCRCWLGDSVARRFLRSPTVAAWLMPYAASLTHSYLSCARYTQWTIKNVAVYFWL